MRSMHRAFAFALFISATAFGQTESARPPGGGPIAIDARMVYGRVHVSGLEPGAKLPRVYVTLFTRRMQATRTTLDEEGFYYFRDLTTEGGTVMVEVDGVEVARQSVMTVGPKQQRLDFQITLTPTVTPTAKPGTISAKYAYERTKENSSLMQKAIDAVEGNKPQKAIPPLKKLLANDPADYPAWTILGAAYTAVPDQAAAESAFLTALRLRPDSVPTLISLGRLYMSMKRYDASVEHLENAARAEPTSAVAFRLVGEAYLYLLKGSKAIPALNEAIRLQPVEMAECHLLLARLYDSAGAKHLASAELKLFLEKVPGHAEKEKMKAYISEHPVQ